MDTRSIRHRIEHTRNKHSRAVVREGMIVIRLARNLTASEARVHIESLLARMRLLLRAERRKVLIDPFRPLLEGGQSLTVRLATGKRYVFRLHPGRKLAAHRRGATITVTVSPGVRRRGLHRFLWSALAAAEQRRIEALVRAVNVSTLRVRTNGVRLGFASSQWGSCSPKGMIMLNAALLFAKPSVLRYVIVHELAHRKRSDHSDAYWQLVAGVLPSYRTARRKLMGYRLPSL